MEYEWNEEKAQEVLEKHGVSFEEIVSLIGRGFLKDVVSNPSKKYKGQKVFLVRKGNSILMVPFEKRNKKTRLITTFPNQHYTELLREGKI